MIHNLEVVNYQSHKKTTLQLHPGVNAIVGESDSGKTAILRALNWLYYNRPSGTAMVSHWNQDDKGNPTAPTYVKADFGERGWVKRVRDANLNGYEYSGQDKPLEAVRTDVPEVLLPIFNVSDVNIQKQMDAPFLLSESSGEVARFFNRIIHLDLIDKVLSRAESLRKQFKRDLEAAETEEKRLTEVLTSFDWTDRAETLIAGAVEVENRLSMNLQLQLNLLRKSEELDFHSQVIQSADWLPKAETLLSNYAKADKSLTRKRNEYNALLTHEETLRSAKTTLKNSDWIPKAEALINQYEKLDNSLWELYTRKGELETIAMQITENQELLKKLPNVSKAETLLSAIEKQVEEVKQSNKKYMELKTLWMRIEELQEVVKKTDVELAGLMAEMPEVCPMCNGLGYVEAKV